MLHGIRQQVHEHLLQAESIPAPYDAGLNAKLHGGAAALDHLAQPVFHFGDEAREVDLLAFEG